MSVSVINKNFIISRSATPSGAARASGVERKGESELKSRNTKPCRKRYVKEIIIKGTLYNTRTSTFEYHDLEVISLSNSSADSSRCSPDLVEGCELKRSNTASKLMRILASSVGFELDLLLVSSNPMLSSSKIPSGDPMRDLLESRPRLPAAAPLFEADSRPEEVRTIHTV